MADLDTWISDNLAQIADDTYDRIDTARLRHGMEADDNEFREAVVHHFGDDAYENWVTWHRNHVGEPGAEETP